MVMKVYSRYKVSTTIRPRISAVAWLEGERRSMGLAESWVWTSGTRPVRVSAAAHLFFRYTHLCLRLAVRLITDSI